MYDQGRVHYEAHLNYRQRQQEHLEHAQTAYARYAAEAKLMTFHAMQARDNGYETTATYFQGEAAECAMLARAWGAALISAMSPD